MNYDDPFSRDPVIRLRQVKKAMAELLNLVTSGRRGSTRRVARYTNWLTPAELHTHATRRGCI